MASFFIFAVLIGEYYILDTNIHLTQINPEPAQVKVP